MSATDRPAAWWLTYADTDPEPDSARSTRDTIPAPPPPPGRYCLIDPDRAAPASRVRACRQTDPCVVPPPGSDRMGAAVVEGRVTVLPPPWAPVRGASDEGKP